MGWTDRSRDGRAGLAGVLIFSGSLPATRAAVIDLDPVFVTLARAAIAGTIGLLLLGLTRQRLPARADLVPLIVVASGFVIGFPLLTAIALRHMSASPSIIFTGLLPLTTAMFACCAAASGPTGASGCSPRLTAFAWGVRLVTRLARGPRWRTADAGGDRLRRRRATFCQARNQPMTRHPFQIVDVFGAQPFAGNPLAIVAPQLELDVPLMQRITRWLNFSETTFLLPPIDPAADYRVRIFTPARELPFAGHPTLGTCHAWLQAGGVPRSGGDAIVQECGAGLVRLRRDGETLAFAAPPVIRSGPVDDDKLREIAGVLRIAVPDIAAAQWVDNGPGWVAVMLGSAEAVLAVEPARSHAGRIDLGVVGPYPKGHRAAYEIRAFFSDPFGGLVEDPVCGSLNASVAQWLIGDGTVAAPYHVTQGSRLGRNGRIHVNQDRSGQIWIGGATASLFSGVAEI